MKNIAVIGGGPAGLAAAIAAFEAGDWIVDLFERKERVGKTILRTGNGRCNFTNLNIDFDKYNNAEFVLEVASMTQFSTLDFMEHLGVVWVANEQGMVFPLSDRAESVLDAFDFYLESSEINVHLNCEEPNYADFDAVVLATGADTSERRYRSGLCPIETNERDVKIANNRRAKCNVKLRRKGEIVFDEDGEVQFRDYGLSGIVVFNASRYARYGDEILLDFTAPLKMDDKKEFFEKRFAKRTYDAFAFFDGFLDFKLANLIHSRWQNHDDFDELWKLLTEFKFTMFDLHNDPKTVQIHCGGIMVNDIDPRTMHWKDNIYVAGEMVDVDGPCGGYNLDWAFRSGYVAGRSAALGY